MIRVFLALTVFIGLLFDLVPVGIGLPRALGTRASGVFTWTTWAQWGLAAAIAYGFMRYARLRERVYDGLPGLGMISFSLVVLFFFAACMGLVTSGIQEVGK